MKLPDILEIKPLAKPPNCTITVPGSKSITNRALILAALSDKKCTLRGALWADDTQVMVDSLQKLGFDVKVLTDPAEPSNRTIEVVGRGGEIPAATADLYVGGAGTAARFLSALVTLGHGSYTIRGDARMNDRPMGELFKALRELGAEVESRHTCLPATIRAKGLRGGKVAVSALSTTQFVSALLLIAPTVGLKVEVAEGDEPHGYIEMTQRMLKEFRPDYTIEPDLSGATYFVAVPFICGGRVTVAGWPENSLQIDGRFPKFLPPPAKMSRLRQLGDGVMTLAICAVFGHQPLEVVEAWQLREQECDRLETMVKELKRVGARAEERSDGFAVWPSAGQLHGADIETYNDHRMAMCFAVLGLKVPGIRIKNPSCVNKTFPNFFDKLEELRR